MAKNKNMHDAKKNKNDEFYTLLPDIENELKYYRNHFKNKTVFLNCDDPTESNFWKYFSLNFEFIGLKKLVSTHFETDKPSYKLELLKYGDDPILTPLKQNGDFRSDECVEILKECDIVVTNPPFSLFREFINLLFENNKKLLVIGNKNSINYKETFSLIKDNKLWLGCTSPKEFIQPDSDEPKSMAGLTRWFTNLEHNKKNEEILLYKKYYDDPTLYPKYDNYDAININKVKDIPMDYYEVVGVPITFMDKFNPEQFEILGLLCDSGENDIIINGTPTFVDEKHKKYKGGVINGKSKYARIIIKRKTWEQ